MKYLKYVKNNTNFEHNWAHKQWLIFIRKREVLIIEFFIPFPRKYDELFFRIQDKNDHS